MCITSYKGFLSIEEEKVSEKKPEAEEQNRDDEEKIENGEHVKSGRISPE